MALNIEDKKAIVAEVAEVAKKAVSAVTANSCGIPVASLTKLRKEARENNVYLHVVRNTLLTRALEGTEFECIKDSCKGPTIIGLSLDHPGAAARIFKNFAKTCSQFEVKALAFEGKAYHGITMSAPGFYGPQGRKVRAAITIPDLTTKLENFSYRGKRMTNIEMESSAIAGLSAVLGHDAATICLAIANRHAKQSNPDYKPLMAELIRYCFETLTK